MGFRDRYGREHDELRISVTDRCNLRCRYCMPVEPEWFPREAILRYEEIARLARIFARRGVRRLRLTGGEPLLRRDLVRLVELLRGIPEVEELSLTTNGVLLEDLAEPLVAAGLQRVNVSLDTLRPERFRALAGRDALARVLRGLEAAAAAGLAPIKINTVLVRGVNDDEAVELARFARERAWELRFIEVMPLDNHGGWDPSRVVPGAEIRRRIEARWPLVRDPEADPRAPATRFLYRDGGGAIGFVDSVSAPFCATCSRLRLTADGKLATCLYAQEETDLRALVRGGASDAEIERTIEAAVARKGRGGALEVLERQSPPPLVRTMHQLGG